MKKLILSLSTLLIALSAHAAEPLLINGSGSTFVYPLYSKWFSDYSKAHPEIHFNYASIGSGGGIKQLTDKLVDFGASDSPMTEAELAKAPGTVHIPTVLGSVVVVHNVKGVTDLKLTPQTLADIFLGKVTRWNDAEIARDNPKAQLPATPITVAHRADGSGTTGVFTDYLAKVSPEWKTKVGAGKSIKWPVGLGGKGNEGVTGLVKQTEGAIGYVELAYANQNKLAPAAIRNHSGAFVLPTLTTTSAAAAGVVLPDDFRISITDAPGANAYPIAAFTYVLLENPPRNPAKGVALLTFLHWALRDGQASASALDYAPLPEPVIKKVEAKLASLSAAGPAAHGQR